jgi:hypothetical protein
LYSDISDLLTKNLRPLRATAPTPQAMMPIDTRAAGL